MANRNYCGETEISSRSFPLLTVLSHLSEKGYAPVTTNENRLHLICAGSNRQAQVEYHNRPDEYKIRIKFSRVEEVA